MTARNSRVDLFADHVEKFAASPEATARKYEAVHAIASAHGFVAPRVLDTLADRVVLERISNIVSLREIYVSRDARALRTVVSRAGEVLALLHAHLPDPGCAAWAPPAELSRALRRYLGKDVDLATLPSAILHGDYSFANLFVLRGSPDQLVVLDPCANHGSTFADWTLAPVYLDIGKMLACLEGQVPLWQQHHCPPPAEVAALQQLFVDAYQRIGPPLDIEVAHACAFAVASAQFRRRFGVLSPLHRLALYNRLRGNFPADRKMHGMIGGQP